MSPLTILRTVQIPAVNNGKTSSRTKTWIDSTTHDKVEKLVNTKHHNFDLEPKVHFSLNGKQIIFRANFKDDSQIYAVDIKKL